jgi:hypothetical protein
MKIHKVPQHIRDAPLPAGYVWHDGDGDHWPVLKFKGDIVGIALGNKAYTFLREDRTTEFKETPVENIDQAFNLINARILLGDGP